MRRNGAENNRHQPTAGAALHRLERPHKLHCHPSPAQPSPAQPFRAARLVRSFVEPECCHVLQDVELYVVCASTQPVGDAMYVKCSMPLTPPKPR